MLTEHVTVEIVDEHLVPSPRKIECDTYKWARRWSIPEETRETTRPCSQPTRSAGGSRSTPPTACPDTRESAATCMDIGTLSMTSARASWRTKVTKAGW